MLSTKRERVEKKVKSLNALLAEYRGELEEAEQRLHRREIGTEEAERIKAKTKARMDNISEKIRAARSELQGLK